ncbi:Hypothetical_protein [Hexamita inflata]|uniref:Hypothetical_protein n=1 Tax=Hexamita inflata TaxID=28002 RepID=A0AA86P4M6_9EUKA|nr:Hypothetical protein HINF_LOCUS18980 [Hexamita inflata]CAI9967294.1 Hypothetical protein HINF_LOCUS54939 [Hexamita inflata]
MQLSSSNVYDLYASSASVNTESRTARPAINDLLHFSKYAFDSQTSFVDIQKPQAQHQNEHILNEKITQLSEDDVDSVHTDQIQRLEQLRLRLLRQKQVQKPIAQSDRVEHMKQILNEQIKQKELQMKAKQSQNQISPQLLNNSQQVNNTQQKIELQNKKDQIQNAIQQQNKTNQQTENSEIEVECATVQIRKRKQKKTNPESKQTNSVNEEILFKETKTEQETKLEINNKDKIIDKQELTCKQNEQIKETSEKQTQMTETQTVSIQTTEQTVQIQTDNKSISNQNASVNTEIQHEQNIISETKIEEQIPEKLETVSLVNQTQQESGIVPTKTQNENTFTNTQQTLTQIPTNGSLSYQNMVTARQISQELNELFQKIQSPSKQNRAQNEKDEIMFLLSEIHPFQKNTNEKDSEETDLLSPFEQTQKQNEVVNNNEQDESSNKQYADQHVNIQYKNDDETSKSAEGSNLIMLKKSEQTDSFKQKDERQNSFDEEIHEQISTNTPNLCNQQPIMTLNTILSESEHSKGNQKLQLQDFEVTQTYRLTKSQKLLSKPTSSNQFNELLVKKVCSKQTVNTVAQQNVSINTQQVVESISQTSISHGRQKDVPNSNIHIINPSQLQSLISPLKSDNQIQNQTNYQIVNATQLIDSNSDQMIPKIAQSISQSNQQDEKYTSEECDQFQQFKNQMLANLISQPLTLSNVLLQSPVQHIDKSQSTDSPQLNTLNTNQSGLNYRIGCKIERRPQQHCIPVQLPNQMRFSLDEPVNYPKEHESSQLNIKVKNDAKTVPMKENSIENEIIDATLSFQNGVDSDSLILSKPEDSSAHIPHVQKYMPQAQTFQSQSEPITQTNIQKANSVEISKNAEQVNQQIVTEQPKVIEQQPEKQPEVVQNTDNNINENQQIAKQIKQEPIKLELKETPDQIQVISLQSKQTSKTQSQQTKSSQVQIAPKKRIKSEMIQNEPSFDEVEVFNVKKQTTCIQNEKQIQTVPKNSIKIENSTSDLVFKHVESMKMQQLESISETTENIGLLQEIKETQDQSKQNKVEQNVHYSLEYQPIKETKVQTPLKLKEITQQNVQNIKINEKSLFDSESLSFKKNVDFSEEAVSWHDSPALKVAVQNPQKEQQKPHVFIPQHSDQQANSQIQVTRTQQSNLPIQQPTRIKITKSNNEYNVQQVAKSNLKYSELSEQTEQLIEQAHQNVVPVSLNKDQSLVNTKSSLIRDFDSVLEAECSAEVQYILQ